MGENHRTSVCWIIIIGGLSVTLNGCGDAQLDTTNLSAESEDLVGSEDPNSGPADESVAGERESGPSPVEARPTVVEVETVVPGNRVLAGAPVAVRCVSIDAVGERRRLDPAEATVHAWPAENFGDDPEPGQVLPLIAGSALVACELPELGLIDETAADLRVRAGRANTTIAEPLFTQVEAGGIVPVSCAVFDREENRVNGATGSLRTDPSDGSVTLVPEGIRFERAGLYHVFCDLPGLEAAYGELVEVVPGPAVSMSMRTVPAEVVYGTNQVVTFATEVVDRFGNRIPGAEVEIVADPAGEPFGSGRFIFGSDGPVAIQASVASVDAIPVSAAHAIDVSGNGPAIRCDSPIDGGFVETTGAITIEGVAEDGNGITALWVDGVEVATDELGAFSASVPAGFGMNYVDIEAEDRFGERNTATCSFLGAEQWSGQGELQSDSVTVRIDSRAIDDGNRSGPPNSVNDLLDTAANSRGLVSQVDGALHEANPLKSSCDVEICVFWCFCVFRSSIEHRNFSLDGPNIAELQLVDGGLSARAGLRGIAVSLRIGGTLSLTGSIVVDRLDVALTTDVGISDGRARASLRSIDDVDVGGVDLRFDGFLGFLIDVVEDIFDDRIRDMIRDMIRDYIEDSFDDVLDGVFGGLGVDNFDLGFDVPRLDGSGATRLDMGVSFSSLDIRSSEAVFGLSTRVSGPVSRPATLPGAPRSPERDASLSGSAISASVDADIFNQALHALWLAGYFDSSVGLDLGEGLPDGAEVSISSELPPVVESIAGDRVTLALGGIDVTLLWPGVMAEPLPIGLGARASLPFSLDGDSLSFGEVSVDDMHFDTPTTALNGTSRDLIEGLLVDVTQGLAREALEHALPALPIPAFDLPPSLGAYGIPTDRALGPIAPSLRFEGGDFVLDSDFGLR